MKKLLSLSVIAGALFASVGCEETKKTPTGGTGGAPKAGDMKPKDAPAKDAKGEKGDK